MDDIIEQYKKLMSELQTKYNDIVKDMHSKELENSLYNVLNSHRVKLHPTNRYIVREDRSHDVTDFLSILRVSSHEEVIKRLAKMPQHRLFDSQTFCRENYTTKLLDSIPCDDRFASIAERFWETRDILRILSEEWKQSQIRPVVMRKKYYAILEQYELNKEEILEYAMSRLELVYGCTCYMDKERVTVPSRISPEDIHAVITPNNLIGLREE